LRHADDTRIVVKKTSLDSGCNTCLPNQCYPKPVHLQKPPQWITVDTLATRKNSYLLEGAMRLRNLISIDPHGLAQY